MIHPLRGGYDKLSYLGIIEFDSARPPFLINGLRMAPDKCYTGPRIARLYPRIARLSFRSSEKIGGLVEVESARGFSIAFYFNTAIEVYDTCIRSHRIALGAGLPDGSRPHAERVNFYKTPAGPAGGA